MTLTSVHHHRTHTIATDGKSLFDDLKQTMHKNIIQHSMNQHSMNRSNQGDVTKPIKNVMSQTPFSGFNTPYTSDHEHGTRKTTRLSVPGLPGSPLPPISPLSAIGNNIGSPPRKASSNPDGRRSTIDPNNMMKDIIDIDEEDVNEETSLTVKPYFLWLQEVESSNARTINKEKEKEQEKERKLTVVKIDNDNKQIIDLINVMTKMSLLVILAVISSILSVLGNTIIEIHLLQKENVHKTSTGTIFIFLLPVTDMVFTSLMLYLQFNFAEKVYRKTCCKLEPLFLRCLLKFIRIWLGKNIILNNGNMHANMTELHKINNPSIEKENDP